MAQDNNHVRGVVLGILAVIVMHALAVLALIVAGLIYDRLSPDPYAFLLFMLPLPLLFLWQLVYVIPAYLWLRRRGHRGVGKGVAIAAVATALLNGGCAIMILSGF